MPHNNPAPRPCNCIAYPFPHRQGAGKCHGGRWICASCRTACTPVKLDFGVGTTEAWGIVSTDRNVQWASPCCETDFLKATA